jgi:hypothetical protein
MQVVLNLAHDPRTSVQTTEAMQRVNDSVDADLHRLAGQVLAGSGVTDPAFSALLFHALRGLAISHVMLMGNPPTYAAGREAEFARRKALLVQAVGLLVVQESGG